MTGVNLNELSRLSKHLNEASDVLGQQIANLEAALNELKLGVWAWVEVKQFPNDEVIASAGKPEVVLQHDYVGYGKHRGKWCLLYMSNYEGLPEDFDDVVPLRDVARMDRLDAVEKFPELIRALEEKAKGVAREATEKAAEIARLVAASKPSKK